MSQHTSTPWNLHPHLDVEGEPRTIPMPDGSSFLAFSRTLAVGETTIATVTAYEGGGGYPTIPIAEVEPTARRIMAAMNACEDVPVEALESGIVRELLAACIFALRVVDGEKFQNGQEHLDYCNQAEQMLRDAIATAKGETL